MNEKTFKKLCEKYSQMITKIINDNAQFYFFNQTIKWKFVYDENIKLFANCSIKTNILSVNVAAIDNSFKSKEFLVIEYFLLHEIRHIYQHIEISKYNQNPALCNCKNLAKKWLNEEKNYSPAIDNNGNENTNYFEQDIELDAYAFAYAVLKYKYKDIPYYIFVPQINKEKFEKIVEEFYSYFLQEKF